MKVSGITESQKIILKGFPSLSRSLEWAMYVKHLSSLSLQARVWFLLVCLNCQTHLKVIWAPSCPSASGFVLLSGSSDRCLLFRAQRARTAFIQHTVLYCGNGNNIWRSHLSQRYIFMYITLSDILYRLVVYFLHERTAATSCLTQHHFEFNLLTQSLFYSQ